MISPDHNFIFCENAKELSIKGANYFIDCVSESINKSACFNVALSGGSTPKALYYLLSKNDYNKNIEWKKVHFFWGDERAVPAHDEESNFRMAFEILLKQIDIPQSNIHRIKGELIEEAAQLYSRELEENIKIKKEGMPVFDLIILGLGSDGHTASLFPGSEAINEKHLPVTSVYVEKLDSTRITMTPPVIKAAKNVLIVVSGKEKATVLNEIMAEDHPVNKYPLNLVNECTGKVTWLIDKDASGKLSMKNFE